MEKDTELSNLVNWAGLRETEIAAWGGGMHVTEQGGGVYAHSWARWGDVYAHSVTGKHI